MINIIYFWVYLVYLMSRSISYLLVVLLLALSGGTAKTCSLKDYNYCKTGLGKKCDLDAKDFSGDNRSEVPFFKRKYKTKGIQVIIPTLPFVNNQLFSYRNDYVPHVSVWDKKTSDVRANCKRGPPQP